MEYYSFVKKKKKELLSHAAFWMDIENMLSEMWEKTNTITYLWNLKDKNMNIYSKMEKDSQV